MADQQLVYYIKSCLEKRHSLESIRQRLINKGWDIEEINKAIVEAQDALSPRPKAAEQAPVVQPERQVVQREVMSRGRPTGITIIAILILLGSILTAIGGALFLVLGAVFSSVFGGMFEGLADVIGAFVAVVGIVVIIFGILGILGPIWLLKMKKKGWILTIIVGIISIICYLILLFPIGIVPAIIWIIFIIYIWRKKELFS